MQKMTTHRLPQRCTQRLKL